MTASSPLALPAAIEAALHLPLHRTRRFTAAGSVYWLKRCEAPGILRRLQKGNPARAFERERVALHGCAALGLPMPPILAEGPDWFVLPDSGTPIADLLMAQVANPDTSDAFVAAGTALAELHGRGISHGRPALKDICWRDGTITFIDLENFRQRFNTASGHGRDLIIFALNGFAIGDGPTPAFAAALAAYRRADRSGTWQQAQAQCTRLRWADVMTKPIQMRRNGKAKEFKAIPYVLDLFSEQ